MKPASKIEHILGGTVAVNCAASSHTFIVLALSRVPVIGNPEATALH